jgi:hypothetical protein
MTTFCFGVYIVNLGHAYALFLEGQQEERWREEWWREEWWREERWREERRREEEQYPMNKRDLQGLVRWAYF